MVAPTVNHFSTAEIISPTLDFSMNPSTREEVPLAGAFNTQPSMLEGADIACVLGKQDNISNRSHLHELNSQPKSCSTTQLSEG